MKKIILGLALGLTALIGAVAFAATGTSPPAGVIYTSPVTVNGAVDYNAGPTSSAIKLSGGTVTCTGGGTPTVTAANLTATSVVMFGLKTAGGTPVAPTMTTVTPGASFVITCGGSDTSVYNFVILG